MVVRQYVLETVLQCKSVAFAASPVHVFVVDDITNDATGKDATQLLPHEYGGGGGVNRRWITKKRRIERTSKRTRGVKMENSGR